MRPKNFFKIVQRKVAISAIGPSALRGQGRGTIRASQEFLEDVHLSRIPTSSEAHFRAWLDRMTESLIDHFPTNGRPWGAARKAINLFLRDALYNQYLSRKFGIRRIERWLELPLDSVVAKGLIERAGYGVLPQWPGLKYLKPDRSDAFQAFASKCARALKLDRVHLDMYLWVENR